MNGYCGYCKEFRRNMSGLTVGDLIKELQKFPERFKERYVRH